MRKEGQDQGELVEFCFLPSISPECSAINILNERKGLLLAFRMSQKEGTQGGRWNTAGFIRQEGGRHRPWASSEERGGNLGSLRGPGTSFSRDREGSTFPLSVSGEALETVPTGEIPSTECHTPFPFPLILMTFFSFFCLLQGLFLSASFYRMKAGMQ